MSLKYFHIVFLLFAILFDGGFWLWTVLYPEQAAAAGALGLSAFAGWTSLILIGYGIWYVVVKSRMIITE